MMSTHLSFHDFFRVGNDDPNIWPQGGIMVQTHHQTFINKTHVEHTKTLSKNVRDSLAESFPVTWHAMHSLILILQTMSKKPDLESEVRFCSIVVSSPQRWINRIVYHAWNEMSCTRTKIVRCHIPAQKKDRLFLGHPNGVSEFHTRGGHEGQQGALSNRQAIQ